ncbi:MAG: sulfotransferase [Pseudomonadota bacterium]
MNTPSPLSGARRPDFLIVGAMKCGTTTLAAQLAAQPGVFMTTPKEPNFFSDDDVWARGLGWYESLFADAEAGDLKGEASTHYTKLPTYGACADRLHAALDDVRLVYITRDPLARLVSHYIHEWSEGVISSDIETALGTNPELVSYSRYAMQIEPYLVRYGAENILWTTLERMRADQAGVLARVGAHIGMTETPVWTEEQAQMNASAERIRRFPGYGLLVDNPVANTVRRTLVPQSLRDAVKARLQKRERPELTAATRARLERVFAEDAAKMAAMFPEGPA